jgi:hypothetical protein
MGKTGRFVTDKVERGQRRAKSGKMPGKRGSKRSDEIRAISLSIVIDDFEDLDDLELIDSLYEYDCVD